MKKTMVLVAATVMLLFGALNADAGIWYAEYPNVPGYYGDDSTVLDRWSWGGRNHLAITWNNSVDTVSAIEMNPDGRPNIYYWGDIYYNVYPVRMYLYYSTNGYNWYYIGEYIYY